MKHKRNLVGILALSFVLSLALLFINQGLVEVSVMDKVMEVVIMTGIFFLFFLLVYLFLALAKRGASKIGNKQKKDLQ